MIFKTHNRLHNDSIKGEKGVIMKLYKFCRKCCISEQFNRLLFEMVDKNHINK